MRFYCFSAKTLGNSWSFIQTPILMESVKSLTAVNFAQAGLRAFESLSLSQAMA
jgi:hypothetical protein